MHTHSADEHLNPMVALQAAVTAMAHAAVDERLKSNDLQAALVKGVYQQLGKTFAQLGQPQITTADFLTPPALLSKGQTLVVLNKHFVAANCFRLVHTTPLHKYATDDWYLFRENDEDLRSTPWVTPTEEETVELERQLKAIFGDGGPAQTRVVSVMVFYQPLESVTYWSPPAVEPVEETAEVEIEVDADDVFSNEVMAQMNALNARFGQSEGVEDSDIPTLSKPAAAQDLDQLRSYTLEIPGKVMQMLKDVDAEDQGEHDLNYPPVAALLNLLDESVQVQADADAENNTTTPPAQPTPL